YRAVLQPAMDQTNRRQFRGCLEDWTLDQLLVDEVTALAQEVPGTDDGQIRKLLNNPRPSG
ncbi:MAG TPA: hypothetical protein VID94_06845, partial [Acidimicrobiales bacterium]